MASEDIAGSSHWLLSHTGKQLGEKVRSTSTTPLTLLYVVRKQLPVNCHRQGVRSSVTAHRHSTPKTQVRPEQMHRNQTLGP